ncbi:MAG: hypothetical protein HUJ63_00715 [Enterococcus sp.]|nr:hypothetical protein [Enterococcus sp.]
MNPLPLKFKKLYFSFNFALIALGLAFLPALLIAIIYGEYFNAWMFALLSAVCLLIGIIGYKIVCPVKTFNIAVLSVRFSKISLIRMLNSGVH